MPYTTKERKLYMRLVKQYGAKKGDEVYHAMSNMEKYAHLFSAKTKRKKKKKKKH